MVSDSIQNKADVSYLITEQLRTQLKNFETETLKSKLGLHDSGETDCTMLVFGEIYYNMKKYRNFHQII